MRSTATWLSPLAGEADPPPHRPRHAASPSSAPDRRRAPSAPVAVTLKRVGLNHAWLLFACAAVPSLAGCGPKGASAAAEHFDRSLEVAVVEAGSGSPVAGVEVTPLLREMTLPRRATGSGGTATWGPGEGYRMDAARAQTVFVVEDPLARYEPIEAPVAEAEGLPERLVLQVRRGVTVRLRVEDAGGDPLAARVAVWSSGRSAPWTAAASPAGDVEIGPVSPGPAKLFISAAGHVTRVVDAPVPARGGDVGTVRLESGGAELTGWLPASLRARPTSAFFRFGGAGLPVAIREDGRFALEGLPETEGRLVFLRHDRELFSLRVEVRGERVDLGEVRP